MASDDDVGFEDLTPPAGGGDAPQDAVPAQADAPEGEDGEAGEAGEAERPSGRLGAVYDIPVHVSAVLGKSRIQVAQLLKLGKGTVIELDRKVGEAFDIYVNNRLVARGEVVVVEERLGITMTEIIKHESTAG